MDTKICKLCGKDKPLNQFSRGSSRSKDGLHVYCKPCANEKGRENYQLNKSRYFANAKTRGDHLDRLIVDAKSKPCTDCGIQYPPYVMEFDHLDPKLKSFNVSYMRRRRMAFSKILDEITKCEIVCANCHRIRTNTRNPSRYTKKEMYN